MSRHLGWRLLLVVVTIAGAIFLTVTQPARLGLDLRGGTQIVLEARPAEGVAVTGDTMDRTLEVLRRRVDQLGVSEPSLQRSGDRRIIVELPGVSDPREAEEVIGRTAQLTFHPVLAPAGELPKGARDLKDEDGAPVRIGPTGLAGDEVSNASAELDPQGTGRWDVALEFRGGGEGWAKLTGTAACAQPGDPARRVAIVLDNQVLSSPQVDPSIACDTGIVGGRTVITGDFTADQAKDLALLIRAGALPVPVETLEQRTVGPSLGAAAIDASIKAAIIGAALTLLYMAVYYRLLGVAAGIGLLAYGVLSFAVLLALRSTLTLPGIAGFVLAIGMAVDANVLVFERIKEEAATGAGLRRSVERGFRNAFSAIADANITTLLAAVLLFFLASGAVRGFGVTLSVGVIVSMFTALVVTRVLLELLVRWRGLERHPALTGMRVGGRFRQWLDTRQPDVMGKARLWFTISLVTVAVAVSGLFLRGLEFGLEFTGGRLLEYGVDGPADIDRVRTEVTQAGLPGAVVQASDAGVTVRTGNLTDAQEAAVDRAVAGVTGSAEQVRDELIGPTIGAELRRKGLIALGLALAAQLAYMAIRFRWTFAVAAVAAMLHDVLILIGVFAWLGKSIDGVFLAALLTVIGYSVNDSVVVFDRIREKLRASPRAPLAEVANDACLQTVPRTINTGLGALFILAALLVLGGESLGDFALALLIGILVGTWSSVFTAAPLAIALERRFGTQPPPARGGGRGQARATQQRVKAKARAAGEPARLPAVAPDPEPLLPDDAHLLPGTGTAETEGGRPPRTPRPAPRRSGGRSTGRPGGRSGRPANRRRKRR
jgi:SecD/SecF fusion protein